MTQDVAAELNFKRERLIDFMNRERLDAVLISRFENIAWLTAGRVDVRIGVPRETGPASLLLTKDNQAYYLTTNNEAARLQDEEFPGLDWKPVIKPWYANDLRASVEQIAPAATVGSDTPLADLRTVNLQPLRLQLHETEVERYRSVCHETAALATQVLLKFRPGMTEWQMQAMLAESLLERGILPSVFLTAVDDRILKYRHAVPRDGVLQRFGMLNFCARKGGLVVSMTRFVHFGPIPADLRERFAVVAQVNAKLASATRQGNTADHLFTVARDAYAAAGCPGEEANHHQGGAIGYNEREWVASPGGRETCLDAQAFAWNPTFNGAKVEDTILLRNGAIELLTHTPDLPVVETSVDGVTYRSAGVLEM